MFYYMDTPLLAVTRDVVDCAQARLAHEAIRPLKWRQLAEFASNLLPTIYFLDENL